MKRQAGPREPESRSAWGPGEGKGGWVGILTGSDEEKRGERATERNGEGLKFEDPGSVEERPWVEGAARSTEESALSIKDFEV